MTVRIFLLYFFRTRLNDACIVNVSFEDFYKHFLRDIK